MWSVLANVINFKDLFVPVLDKVLLNKAIKQFKSKNGNKDSSQNHPKYIFICVEYHTISYRD